MKLGIRRVENQTCVCLDLGFVLDALSESDRRELVSEAIHSGELLKAVCRQIVAKEDADSPHANTAADIILDDRTIGEMREILATLISPAVAEELRKAREIAELNVRSAAALRGLVHVDALREAATTPDERKDRSEQWQSEWHWAKQLFPQYHAANKEPQ